MICSGTHDLVLSSLLLIAWMQGCPSTHIANIAMNVDALVAVSTLAELAEGTQLGLGVGNAFVSRLDHQTRTDASVGDVCPRADTWDKER